MTLSKLPDTLPIPNGPSHFTRQNTTLSDINQIKSK
jgi:hypothetical protein